MYWRGEFVLYLTFYHAFIVECGAQHETKKSAEQSMFNLFFTKELHTEDMLYPVSVIISTGDLYSGREYLLSILRFEQYILDVHIKDLY